MSHSRRKFIKQFTLASTGTYLATMGMSAKSYANILGANDRVRVNIVGFSDRFRSSLFPAFMNHYKKLNFDITGVSDLWSYRRDLGTSFLSEKLGHPVKGYRNNDELYAAKDVDAVIISTADFLHALHAIEAVSSKCDAYVEKPFAETMEDARAALKAIKNSKQIIQIGSQRRSGANYQAANEFIKSGKFGDIYMVELTWNVNQPGRWRRPELVAKLKKEDTDWNRYLANRPHEEWDPRKYLEYRLFWPFSSGLPGQWMSHQIDTVHWFSGLKHPRSVTANGGIYQWKDGRRNWDTITAAFEYGPEDDLTKGFQVVFQSRMGNGSDQPSEIYYSNGGELNLINNRVSPKGGLKESAAKEMGMKENLLPDFALTEKVEKVAAGANTGGDPLTSNHMLNWMECVRSRKQTNAPAEAGYMHSIANIMTTAASHTGMKATFDEKTQEVMVGGKAFKF
ncbi:MAG: Gfo/Idh/MocA family oxidoreductase [Niabella sp.]|nr:Gfo/Idh/MocA family oxidoreductase [Niabella sp.]